MSAGNLAVLFLGLLIVTQVNAATITITSPNPNPYVQGAGQFGASVVSANGLLIVGAPFEAVNRILYAGRAYVFNATTGSLMEALVSPNAQEEGRFGASLSFADDRLIVGAPSETVNGLAEAGRAYVFNAATGFLIDTLVSPNPVGRGFYAGGGFGASVALGDGLMIVGAPREIVNRLSLAGRAYVFSATTDALTDALVSPNPEGNGYFTGGFFGSSVALASGRVIVGAPGETVNGFANAGRAYVFSPTTGSLTGTLVSPNANPDDGAVFAGGRFGASVTSTNGRVVVGAPDETVNGTGLAGRVYVFSAATDSLMRTLVSPNVQLFGRFGDSIALANGHVIVGADEETVNGVVEGGRAYIFNAATGSLIRTLVSLNNEVGGFFGASVALANGHVIIGAPDETVNGLAFVGRVYIF